MSIRKRSESNIKFFIIKFLSSIFNIFVNSFSKYIYKYIKEKCKISLNSTKLDCSYPKLTKLRQLYPMFPNTWFINFTIMFCLRPTVGLLPISEKNWANLFIFYLYHCKFIVLHYLTISKSVSPNVKLLSVRYDVWIGMYDGKFEYSTFLFAHC